jgi:hypothetical protein
MAKNPHLVTPPNRLGDRIRRTGGPTPEQAILRALNAAEDLMDEYQGWAVDDLTKLWQAFEASVDGAPSTAQILQMFEIAHGIRGEGGSFGFPLVSVISDSLCKLLEGKKSITRPEQEVVKVHILAMRAVFRQKLAESQPKLEGELRQLLTLLRYRMERRV